MDLDADVDVPYRRREARPDVQLRHQYSSHLEGQGLDAKVVVMGNTAVGKTSLLKRYVEDKFTPASTTSTTGALFVTKKVVVEGLKVRLQLWDTAGQERFRSMAPMYYRGASAAILVYDITDSSTFDAVRIWLEELKRNHHLPSSGDDPPLIIYIVGAKADLASKKREVTQEQARKSLHAWFPPPPKEPPPSSKPSSTSSSYGRVGGLSYIRPRFTSLTTVPSAPPPKVDNSTAAAALNRAKSARVAPLGKRLNGDASSPGDWRRQVAGARERRWSDAMMWDNAMREEEHSPLHSSNTSPNDEDDFNATDDEELYPLEKGMELFEVSAKDNAGVQNLFAHMIDNIIRRRHIIESERVERERNSVVLKPMSSWRDDGDETASRSSRDPMHAHHKNGGWSCCSS